MNGITPDTVMIPESPYTVTVNPLITTTYTILSVTNEACSGLGTGSAMVTLMPKPNADFSFVDNCSGHTTSFNDLTTVALGSITSWLWDFGYAGATSNIQNPSYTYPSGGTYDVSLMVETNNTCRDTVVKPLQINPTPLVNAGNDKSIPYGTNTSLSGIASGGTGSYIYHWEPASLLINSNVPDPVTVNLSETTDFTLTVTDQNNQCAENDVVTITITGGPLGVVIHPSAEAICLGSTCFLNSMAGGGSGTYSYNWTSNPPGFTSTLEDVTVQPTVTTTYTVSVNDGFNNFSKSFTLIVWPQPQANAGSDNSTFHGGYVHLNGSVSSGTSPFSYAWQPENLVTSPTTPSTATANLTTSTNFYLHITDANGCNSEDDVLVTITGVALNVNPFASQSPVCPGDSTRLFPMTEGGSGNYSYQWSSVPGGFVSQAAQPVVNPLSTTTYIVHVYDGFNTKQDSVMVIVNPRPIINLIPANSHIAGNDTILACVFDTIVLRSPNPNSDYIWSNGATADSIVCSTSGIAFDMQSYWLKITNHLTGCSVTDSLTIIFTYSDCSYGVGEQADDAFIFAYPNPSADKIYITGSSDRKEKSWIRLYSTEGQLLREQEAWQGKNLGILDVSDCPAGIYILKISGSNLLKVIKIVKP
jgi:PKD repeat protein